MTVDLQHCYREELINRVSELVTDERKRLERQQVEEERLAKGESLDVPSAADEENGETVRKSTDTGTRVPTGPMPEVERGLCVVCQDEEATLAVVDCGCVTWHRSHKLRADCLLPGIWQCVHVRL